MHNRDGRDLGIDGADGSAGRFEVAANRRMDDGGFIVKGKLTKGRRNSRILSRFDAGCSLRSLP
jgi:hypothetical protein